MEAIGTLIMLGGIVFLMFTGIRYSYSQRAFASCLKIEHKELWQSLGQPELNPFQPFRSVPLTNLVFTRNPGLGADKQLIAYHAKARYWFFAFGINFGVVFLGAFILGASS